jgi:hypothetical protein
VVSTREMGTTGGVWVTARGHCLASSDEGHVVEGLRRQGPPPMVGAPGVWWVVLTVGDGSVVVSGGTGTALAVAGRGVALVFSGPGKWVVVTGVGNQGGCGGHQLLIFGKSTFLF